MGLVLIQLMCLLFAIKFLLLLLNKKLINRISFNLDIRVVSELEKLIK